MGVTEAVMLLNYHCCMPGNQWRQLMEQFLTALMGVALLSACASDDDKRFDQFMFKAKYCREYTQTLKVGGKDQETWGQACLLPDGTWEVQKK
jgi:hypothetical protein